MSQDKHAIAIYAPPIIAAVALVPLVAIWAADVSLPALQVGIFLIALGSLAAGFLDMLIRDIRRTYRNTIHERMVVIGIMVVETVALFAVAYLQVSEIPGEIAGLKTVLDAVYFTMTTLMTIGFGDVAAEGQLARGLVLLQMLFTILLLTSSVRLFSSLVMTSTKDAGRDHP